MRLKMTLSGNKRVIDSDLTIFIYVCFFVNKIKYTFNSQ